MQQLNEVRVRRLEASDDRSLFASGDPDLDRFFHRFAGQNQFRYHIGTTYIAESDGQIVGFATVSVGEMTSQTLSRADRLKLPGYPLPILRIARLAVDRQHQGQGIGRLLLKAMFILALELKQRVGCVGVVVDAKPSAIEFYQRLGFLSLTVDTGELADRPALLPMFLPIRLIEQANS